MESYFNSENVDKQKYEILENNLFKNLLKIATCETGTILL